MQGDFAIFDFPFSADLETLLAKDINGLYYCRLTAAIWLLLLCSFPFVFNNISLLPKYIYIYIYIHI